MKPTIIAIKVLSIIQLQQEEVKRHNYEVFVMIWIRSDSEWLTRHSYPENI
jgi:hypothetical protein